MPTIPPSGAIPIMDFTKNIDNIGDMEKNMETLINFINDLRAEMSQPMPTIQLDKGISMIKNAKKQLKELQGIRETLNKKQTDSYSGFEVNNYKELTSAIDTYKEHIESLRNSLKNGTSTNFQQDLADLKAFQAQLKQLQSTKAQLDGAPKGQSGIQSFLEQLKSVKSSTVLKGAKDIASAFGTHLISAIKSVGDGFKSLGTNIASLVSGGFNMLKSAVSTTVGNMRNLVSGGFNLAKKGIEGFKSGLKTVRNHMNLLVKKSTPNLLKSFSSLKSMLMRRIKRTFISSIFNQAKEGLQQLAKSSASFNQSMTNIKNTTAQVAGNLSITLGNMVQTIEPYLMKVLSWINKIFEAINGLFALISGKSTMMVATKGTKDYAKSLKSAGGAAKDLNHQLYGFDELTRQEDNSGGGGSNIGFETKELVGGINDFFKQIVEAFKAGEFEKVGNLIAEKLDSLVVKINDWIVDLRPKAVQWANNIAEILNGMLSFDLFNHIGELIGNGLNLVFDTFNTFLTKFDFAKLGQVLASGVNKLFNTIEWDLIGETIINWFNSVWRTLGNFFANLDWVNIGNSLATAVSSIFSNIDWESFKQMWSEGINGVFEMLYTFFSSVDWATIATDIDTNLTDLIANKINWETIKNSLSEMVKSLQEVFHVLTNSEFFTTLATKLGETVGGILKEINWGQLVADLFVGFLKLRTAFWNFITAIDIPGLAVKLAGAINGLLTDENVQNAFTESSQKVKEGFDAIIKAFMTLVSGPPDGIDFSGIANKVVNGINSFFSEEGFGVSITNAVTAVSEGLNRIIEVFATLLDPEKGIDFTTISSKLAESINGLVKQTDWATLISTLMNLHLDIQQAFWNVMAAIDWNDIGTKLADGVNLIFSDKTRFANLGESISNAIKGVLEGISTLIQTIDWDKVVQGLIAFVQGIDWTGVLEAILNCLLAVVSGVGTLISSLWQAIFGGGGGQEQVEIPQILSDDIMAQLKAQMGEAGKELAHELNQSLIENINDAGSDYEAARQLFLNSAAEIGLGFQDKLEETLRKNGVSEATIASLTQQTKDLFEACKAPDATVESIKEQFRQSGIWITDGLAEAFQGQGQENIATALQLLALGVDQETIAALDMSHLNENLTNYMNQSGESIEAVAGTMGANVGEKIGGTIPEFINKALQEGKSEIEKTAQEVQEAADTSANQTQAGENAKETGETVIEKLDEGMDSSKPEERADGVKESIEKKLSTLPDDEKKQAEEMMQYIVDGITNGDPLATAAIEKAAQEIVKKAEEILSEKNGTEIAKTFISGMSDGIDSEGGDNLVPMASSVASDVLSELQDYLNRSEGYDLAYYLAQGLVDGLDGYTASVCSAARSIGASLLSALKSELGIASPSKAFAEIGNFSMQGLVKGIESQEGNVLNTMSDLADAMTDENSGMGIEGSVGTMVNGLDTVADKMSRIAQIFADIRDTIVSMGGFIAPTIANGQVIPYRAQLGATSSGIGGDNNSFEDSLYNAITRAMGNSNGEQAINITLQIDGRKMADIVSKYQRQQSRAWGV